MQIFIENETKEFFDFRGYKKLIGTVVETCGLWLQIPADFEVNVMIVSGETIRSINQETRGIDRVTDVLSFPYFEFPSPGETSALNLAEGETILGDIILCAEKVVAQAAEFGHSQKRELAYLTVHSMLHLTGYDHMTKEEEKVMTDKAECIMEELGLSR